MLWWFAAASAEPFYDAVEHRVVVHGSDTQLRSLATRELRSHHLPLVLRTRAGAEERVRPSSRRVGPLVSGLIVTLLRGEEGAEIDVVIDARDDGGYDLATVRWEPDRVVLEQGATHAQMITEGPDVAELRERYGIGVLVGVGRDWDPLARGVLRDAMERLTPAERAVLADLPFHRTAAPSARLAERLDEGTPSAVYAFDGAGERIEVYDVAVDPSSSFRGSPWAPVHPSVAVVLHELGHALAHVPDSAMNRIIAADDADVTRIHELEALERPTPAERDEHEQLVHTVLARRAAAEGHLATLKEGAPLVRAWLEATGGETPTRYGETSPEEGFAEAFALHRCDPEALARAAPRSYAWFEQTDLAALTLSAAP
ncbi:MAG: hypothetical protein R3F59_27105 [Myxococcota bacterium]